MKQSHNYGWTVARDSWTCANIPFPNCNPNVHLDWRLYVRVILSDLLYNPGQKYPGQISKTIRQRSREGRGVDPAPTGNWGEEV